MSASTDVVVVENDGVDASLAKPVVVVVELVVVVVEGSHSRRLADRSSHTPTPSTYDEFQRPRFIVVVVVVELVVVTSILCPRVDSDSDSDDDDDDDDDDDTGSRRTPTPTQNRLPSSPRDAIVESRADASSCPAVIHSFIHASIHRLKRHGDRPKITRGARGVHTPTHHIDVRSGPYSPIVTHTCEGGTHPSTHRSTTPSIDDPIDRSIDRSIRPSKGKAIEREGRSTETTRPLAHPEDGKNHRAARTTDPSTDRRARATIDDRRRRRRRRATHDDGR